jgi:lysine biosynthesis protein LysW
MKSKKRVECPICRETFHLENWLKIGNQVYCPNCEELLEVVNLKPFTLDFAYTADWGDYEEEDREMRVSRKQI